MPIAFIRWGRDPEALYTVIAIAMVAGTLLVGLAAVALRCPRCGYDFVKEVFGGLDLRTKRMNRTIVALARPLRCPSCDLSEDDRGSERWGA